MITVYCTLKIAVGVTDDCLCVHCRNVAGDCRHAGPRFSRLPDTHAPMGVLTERCSPSLYFASWGDRGQGLTIKPIPTHTTTIATLVTQPEVTLSVYSGQFVV